MRALRLPYACRAFMVRFIFRVKGWMLGHCNREYPRLRTSSS